MIKGTKVMNPAARGGWKQWSTCRRCNKVYTALGISRHWDKCPKKPVETKK
jgi:hypothetical protein